MRDSLKLTFTFDRTLHSLRTASMLSSAPGLGQLPGTIALERGNELLVLTGDLFLLTRELLEGMSKLIAGRSPRFMLMTNAEQWELNRLGGWISVQSMEVRASDGGAQQKPVGRIRSPRLRLARSVLKGTGELLLQLFAINSQLEMLPAVAEIRRAHQHLTEAVEAVGSEPLGRRLERWRNELTADKWKTATVALSALVLMQFAMTLVVLRSARGPAPSTITTQKKDSDQRNLAQNSEAAPTTKPSGVSLSPSVGGLLLSPPKLNPLLAPKLEAPTQLPPAAPVIAVPPTPTQPPALPRLVGTIETTVSSAALFEDGNTVEVYSVGAQVPGGWVVTRVDNGNVSLVHGEGKHRIVAQVSIPAFTKPPPPLTIPGPRG